MYSSSIYSPLVPDQQFLPYSVALNRSSDLRGFVICEFYQTAGSTKVSEHLRWLGFSGRLIWKQGHRLMMNFSHYAELGHGTRPKAQSSNKLRTTDVHPGQAVPCAGHDCVLRRCRTEAGESDSICSTYSSVFLLETNKLPEGWFMTHVSGQWHKPKKYLCNLLQISVKRWLYAAIHICNQHWQVCNICIYWIHKHYVINWWKLTASFFNMFYLICRFVRITVFDIQRSVSKLNNIFY